MVTLTENAAVEIRRIMEENSLGANAKVRLAIKGGGCAGFTYIFDFEKEAGKFDRFFQSHGIDIVVDRKSLIYVDGTEIDFNTSLTDRGFKFANPRADAACGCGTSFMPKQQMML